MIMYRFLFLLVFILYIILGILGIKNHSKLLYSKTQKIILCFVYFIFLILIIYFTLFIVMFGYNS